jgi:hypothetical protein
MLISKETSDALDLLYGQFFDLNATLDVVASTLQNAFSMPKAADIVHHKISHLMPLLADKISEIKDNYNIRSIRPSVHEDRREYSDLYVMFQTVLDEFESTYKMIVAVQEVSIKSGDKNVLNDLQRFMCVFNKVMGQIYTLRDKAEQLPRDFDTYDAHIDRWGIVGVDLEKEYGD